jgi:hypothetical protein
MIIGGALGNRDLIANLTPARCRKVKGNPAVNVMIRAEERTASEPAQCRGRVLAVSIWRGAFRPER